MLLCTVVADGCKHSRCKHPAMLHKGSVRAAAATPCRRRHRLILLPKDADQNRLEVYPKLIEGRGVGEVPTAVWSWEARGRPAGNGRLD